jgi:xanthine dehydrogenase YagS FAD-binding subunit
MKPFEYLEPATLDSAFTAIGADSDTARFIAGGSDLLGELKEGIAQPSRLVSLSGVEGLRGISMGAKGLRIGATTTLADLEHAPELDGPYRLLAEAARSVATPEVRYQGTLGGNLCQRPRCLHFRSALVSCLKKGGEDCPAAESPYQAYLAVTGAGGCYAVVPSDLAPPLIALDAIASIAGPSGARDLRVADLYAGPEDPRRETRLAADELITAVTLPSVAPGWRGIYSKSRERTAGDFAVVSGAVGFELAEGRMRNCRIVLGGIAPAPLRSLRAEQELEGEAPGAAVASRAASLALAGATPLTHNAFKLDLAHALITRAVLRLASAQPA